MTVTTREVGEAVTGPYRFDRVHRALNGIDGLDDEQVKQYHERGFVAIENVLSAEEIEAAKAGLADLVMGKVAGFDGVEFETGVDVGKLNAEERERYVRKLMWFVKHEARLRATAEHPKLLAIVERLVGSKVKLIQDMALLKPPHIGREKPWHQDNAYFLVEPFDLVIGTWTALDEATVENGCMHMIPGSHKKGPQAHYHDRDCQLPDDVVAVEEDVVVPLRPGGTLFFYGLLHHGTPANRSATRRRALQYHYASLSCRSIAPERHAELFHDGKGYAGCTGWAFEPKKPGRKVSDRG